MSEDRWLGQVLGDTYQLTHLIGGGGMGKVYRAKHLRLGRKQVAVKILLPHASADPILYARFQREAEIIAALGHPHIIEIHDFNVTAGGDPYLVMELLEGIDLAARLERRSRLRLPELTAIIAQVGSALMATHREGVVHRDLKPENIFLVRRPSGGVQAKLLDFGLSKLRDSRHELTVKNSVFGTPLYMSPEQAAGKTEEVDHATDIFALGVMAYECLSGAHPFEAPTPFAILERVLSHHPPPLRQQLPELPPAVDVAIARALAKRKADRYERVEDFVRDLGQGLERRQAAAILAILAWDRPDPLTPSTTSSELMIPAASVTPAPLARTLPPAPQSPGAASLSERTLPPAVLPDTRPLADEEGLPTVELPQLPDAGETYLRPPVLDAATARPAFFAGRGTPAATDAPQDLPPAAPFSEEIHTQQVARNRLQRLALLAILLATALLGLLIAVLIIQWDPDPTPTALPEAVPPGDQLTLAPPTSARTAREHPDARPARHRPTAKEEPAIRVVLRRGRDAGIPLDAALDRDPLAADQPPRAPQRRAGSPPTRDQIHPASPPPSTTTKLPPSKKRLRYDQL